PAALEDRLAKAERLPTDIIRRDQLRSVEDREHLAFKSGDPRLGIVVERSARLNLDEDRVVAGVPLRKIANGLETIGEERAVRLVVRLGDMLDAIAFEEGIVDQIELESAHALLLELNEDGGMIVTPIDNGMIEASGAVAIVRCLQLDVVEAELLIGRMHRRNAVTGRQSEDRLERQRAGKEEISSKHRRGFS